MKIILLILSLLLLATGCTTRKLDENLTQSHCDKDMKIATEEPYINCTMVNTHDGKVEIIYEYK